MQKIMRKGKVTARTLKASGGRGEIKRRESGGSKGLVINVVGERRSIDRKDTKPFKKGKNG